MTHPSFEFQVYNGLLKYQRPVFAILRYQFWRLSNQANGVPSSMRNYSNVKGGVEFGAMF
ncbi:hypothetical protein ACSBR1_031989 [Camellia fascicularis]